MVGKLLNSEESRLIAGRKGFSLWEGFSGKLFCFRGKTLENGRRNLYQARLKA
jgi:hypothetical protein